MRRSRFVQLAVSLSLGVLPLCLPPMSSAVADKTKTQKETRYDLKGRNLVVIETNGKGQGRALATLRLPARPAEILQRGDYLYAACRRQGLVVIEVSDPTNPRITDTLAKGRDVVGLRVEGGLLVIAVASYRVQAFSLAEPGKPSPLFERAGLVAPPVERKTEGVVGATPAEGDRRPAETEKDKPASGTPRRVDTEERADRASESRPGGDEDGERREKKREKKEIRGRVVEVRRRWVVVNRGEAHGLAKGDRIAILSGKKVKVRDPIRKTYVMEPSGNQKAVIEVSHVGKDWARAKMGRGDDAAAGDRFVTTTDPVSETLFFPERQGGMYRIKLGVWPVIGIDTQIFGLMAFSSIAYHFTAPFKIEVMLSPFTTVMGDPHSAASANVVFNVGYSTSYIELSLGAGYQGVMYGRSGFAMMQGIRLGSIDGLNVTFVNQLVLSDRNAENERRFMVGSMSGVINIPIIDRISLFLSGGAGSAYYGYGDVGIRTYVRGTGDPGTIILSGSLGGAWLKNERKYTTTENGQTEVVRQTAEAVGVTFSFGVDLRL